MKVKTKEEWQALVEKLKSSGMTKSEFCRRNQIASSRFYDWAKEYGGGIIPPSSIFKKVKTPKKISKFIEIELVGKHCAARGRRTIRPLERS